MLLWILDKFVLFRATIDAQSLPKNFYKLKDIIQDTELTEEDKLHKMEPILDPYIVRLYEIEDVIEYEKEKHVMKKKKIPLLYYAIEGEKPFFSHIGNCSFKIVDLLIRYGADIN